MKIGVRVTREEDFEIDLSDPGRGIPKVIGAEIARDMSKIKGRASKATVADRKRHGIPGRRWGYATGHLAESLRAVVVSEGPETSVYAIQAPEDRLDPTHFGADYAAFRARLNAEVPALGDPVELWRRPKMQREAAKQLRLRIKVRRK